MLVVMTGWIWFRAKDTAAAIDMFASIVGLNGSGPISFSTHLVLYPITLGAMAVGAALAVVPRRSATTLLQRILPNDRRMVPAWMIDTPVIAVFFALSVVTIAAGSYSPFLYFRF
jgi:hypothetical protein